MIRVIKLGGRAQSDPDLIAALAADALRHPGRLCVVHGGGQEISSLQRALGSEPVFSNGRRVTTASDLDLVRMVLSGAANKRLVAALGAHGAPAWGISGEDAGLLEAEPLHGEFGFAGTPSSVNVEALRLLLGAGYLPVVSPLAGNAAGGGALNVNGDDAAAALAGALEAAELIFISDVPGVMNGSGTAYQRLTIPEARELVTNGSVTGGMCAKLEAADRALAAGVGLVRIAGAAAVSDALAGTAIAAAAREALV